MRFWRRYRTIILGAVAMALLVASAIYTFDVPWQVMLRLMLYCLLMLVVLIGLAALTVGVYVTLRKKLNR